MQRKLVSRIVATVVCGLLVAASSARADDKDKETACSDRTIEGDYASAVDGVILPAPGVSLSIRGINMVHNDGKGHSTVDGSIVVFTFVSFLIASQINSNEPPAVASCDDLANFASHRVPPWLAREAHSSHAA